MVNKKLIVEFPDKSKKCCILSCDRDFDDQLGELYGFKNGYGLAAEIRGDKVAVVDVFHQDFLATLPIISFEDCEEETHLEWREA